MVIYDLACPNGHQFEGWFKNAEELAAQTDQGLLTCPYCDSAQISKRPTAAKLVKKSNTGIASSHSENTVRAQSGGEIVASGNEGSEKFATLQRMLGKVHDYIEQNFEDVGHRFADEAISIHRGEKDPANIRGNASRDQLKQMAEEGVDAVPLPPRPIDYKKIN